MFRAKILWLVLVVLVAVGCSVRAPEVQVTGEKTALENQVIGTYKQVENDSWMVVSTRAADTGKPVVLSTEKEKVLDAIQNRKFNKDDIDEFKRKGLVGENNRGFLEARPSPELDANPELAKLVTRLVAEDNQDRQTIMGRVMEVNEELQKAGKEEVYAVFAKMNRESAEHDTWIQQPDGTWVKKGKE